MPPTRQHRILLASAFIAAALGIESAHAADYTLRVEAPSECADEARLLEAIRVRSPGFTPAAWNTPGASHFLVRFVPGATDIVVELETTDASGARSLRRVPAQDCPEAVRASAWILALLVDPAAAAAEPAPPIATATRGATAPIVAATPAAAPPVAAPAPNAAPPAAPPTPATAPAVTPATPAAASVSSNETIVPGSPETAASPEGPWQISIGGFGGVLQSALPETPLGLGVFVEAAWERESWFRPSTRLAGLDAGSGVSREADRGEVVVDFVGGRLSLCPLRSSRAKLLSVRFCGLMEVGRLSGEGQNTADEGSATPTWYAAGPALGLELQSWSFLAFELEGALILPFNRDRFVFEPDPTDVGYEVPPVSVSVALGIAWRSSEYNQQYPEDRAKESARLIARTGRGH